MTTRFFCSLAFLFLLLFGSGPISAQAQEQDQEKPAPAPRPFMQPYSLSHKRGLKVGQRVWVNFGDTECAYGAERPRTSTRCFREYGRGKIVEISMMYGHYVYTAEFRFGRGNKITRNAPFDELFYIHNLPAKIGYTPRFLRLNW